MEEILISGKTKIRGIKRRMDGHAEICIEIHREGTES